MLNYKLAAVVRGAGHELSINDAAWIASSFFEREGRMDEGVTAVLAESIGNDESALKMAAECMTGIRFDVKDSFVRRKNAMYDAIVSANEKAFVNETSGCTAVSAVIHGNKLAVTNLGGCAAFLMHYGKLKRLTDEHCQYEDADNAHQQCYSRYIGYADKQNLDLPVYEDEKFDQGDVLLLCSSAVCDTLSDNELLSILELPISAAERIDKLTEAVCAADSSADIGGFSAMIMEVGRDGASAIGSFKGKRIPEIHESPWYALVLAIIFIAAAIIIIIAGNNRGTTAPNDNNTNPPVATGNNNWNPLATPIPNNNPTGDLSGRVDLDATPTPFINQGGNKVNNSSLPLNTRDPNATIIPGSRPANPTPAIRPTMPPGGGGWDKPTSAPPYPTANPPIGSQTPPADKPTPELPTGEPVTDAPATDVPVDTSTPEPTEPDETPTPTEPVVTQEPEKPTPSLTDDLG